MDAIATRSGSAATKLSHSRLQLSYVDSISQIGTCCHTCNLTRQDAVAIMSFPFAIRIGVCIANSHRIGRSCPYGIPIFISKCCRRFTTFLITQKALFSSSRIAIRIFT